MTALTEIPHLDKLAEQNACVLVSAAEIVALRDELAQLRAAQAIPSKNELFAEGGHFDYLIYAVGHLEQFYTDVFDEAQEALDGVRKYIETTNTEYKALWDAVIAYANAPGVVWDSDKEQYSALVGQAMRSRFWNEATK